MVGVGECDGGLVDGDGQDGIGGETGLDAVGTEQLTEAVGNEQTATAVYTRKSTRKLRPTVMLTSPFRARHVDFAQKMNKIHNVVAKWVFDNVGAKRTEVLFRMGDTVLMREYLETMRLGEYISVNVIDVWAKLLNEMEEVRDANSPPRLFLTNMVTLYSVVSHAHDLSDERVLALFPEAFDLEFVDLTAANLQAIEMFFFWILKSEHNFLICINIKKKHCHILDMSSVGGTSCDSMNKCQRNCWMCSLDIRKHVGVIRQRVMLNNVPQQDLTYRGGMRKTKSIVGSMPCFIWRPTWGEH